MADYLNMNTGVVCGTSLQLKALLILWRKGAGGINPRDQKDRGVEVGVGGGPHYYCNTTSLPVSAACRRSC